MAETPVDTEAAEVRGLITVDQRPVDFTPTAYVPIVVQPPFPATVEEVAGHLAGIDAEIGTLSGVQSAAAAAISATNAQLSRLDVPIASVFYGTGWTIRDNISGQLRTLLPNTSAFCRVADLSGSNRARVRFEVRDLLGTPVTCRVYADGVLSGTVVSAGTAVVQQLNAVLSQTAATIWTIEVRSGGSGGEYRWNTATLFKDLA